MKSEVLKLAGMNGIACVGIIERALKSVDGVAAVNVSLADCQVTVQFDAALATRTGLADALLLAGFPADAARPAHGNGSCCGSCGG